eukprot:scaffold92201_cov16-Prasinocladus_malaysianus.AAC.1
MSAMPRRVSRVKTANHTLSILACIWPNLPPDPQEWLFQPPKTRPKGQVSRSHDFVFGSSNKALLMEPSDEAIPLEV